MSPHSAVMYTVYSTVPWTLGSGGGAAWIELPLRYAASNAACNPIITSIIRTPITKHNFETKSFLIPWRNVKYFEIWTVVIDFVNDDNLFRIVVIEMFLPTTSSYCAWVFLALTLRLQWYIWIRQKSSRSVVARVLPEPDRSAFNPISWYFRSV